MDSFRVFYSRINTVMTTLYSKELKEQVVKPEPTVLRADKINSKADLNQFLV